MRSIVFLLSLFYISAFAADKAPVAAKPSTSKTQAPAPGLQIVNVPALQEIKGVVSWETLAQVVQSSSRSRITAIFTKEILALNDQEVKIQGFMMPLDPGQKQKHFLVSVNSSTCPYCMPAGPEGVVEVLSTTPIKYGFEPIIVSGKFAVLKDDPMGIYYRLTNAVQAPAK
jgi:hypothetical protein